MKGQPLPGAHTDKTTQNIYLKEFAKNTANLLGVFQNIIAKSLLSTQHIYLEFARNTAKTQFIFLQETTIKAREVLAGSAMGGS